MDSTKLCCKLIKQIIQTFSVLIYWQALPIKFWIIIAKLNPPDSTAYTVNLRLSCHCLQLSHNVTLPCYTSCTIKGVARSPANMRGSCPFRVGLPERLKGEETHDRGRSWYKKVNGSGVRVIYTLKVARLNVTGWVWVNAFMFSYLQVCNC